MSAVSGQANCGLFCRCHVDLVFVGRLYMQTAESCGNGDAVWIFVYMYVCTYDWQLMLQLLHCIALEMRTMFLSHN